MKLDMVGIITKDMAKAIQFYETLGFTISSEASDDYVELKHEGIRLSLNSAKMLSSIYGYEPKTGGDKIELAFLCDTVNDVDALYDKMTTAGYVGFKAPWDAFWGQRYAIIKDIDGHLLSLFANIGA
ncbi:glyoxylase [Lactococcus piscium]|uniref:VOC family protein n=1 Tax=Pseudolactococcus carnosus TaxID=2749961 RepID=UPI0015DC1048|nr:VOC family protein [Lactococcus carnosus]MCJ1974483.1 glyoxylase [Lactococcus carnosus]MCJ1982505.1 glyoxylase [Lactococcus carnosus]MCJ1984700.1 glyoxylase [Lactococcus carnosus]MCJ1987221.1 glyoxylase [Lactococcus carnosus]MCJ1992691.1 glyoxylase [Lactococcus carnosus]